MNEFDVAHLYGFVQLRRTTEDCIKERDFWRGLALRHMNSQNNPYYVSQFQKYADRVVDLLELQKEKFGE